MGSFLQYIYFFRFFMLCCCYFQCFTWFCLDIFFHSPTIIFSSLISLNTSCFVVSYVLRFYIFLYTPFCRVFITKQIENKHERSVWLVKSTMSYPKQFQPRLSVRTFIRTFFNFDNMIGYIYVYFLSTSGDLLAKHSVLFLWNRTLLI